ncbi:hypothetical protein [Propionispora vibrioides]|jgi:hypothetical protein|uniref:Uncharacterized protein n=1 Tax=Propionispora vibrioides TaxID=112903 RepID=A0A1H8NV32_9FIRM|nr:hypothetical protein [Propionispora vibrioides]SEO33490.1 hypothetical protein SAMN04490178_101243 [Propionispora vibrioides]
MYKLIIGNVRITVHDDDITRQAAADAAKQAIHTSGQQGKLLSLIELRTTADGIDVQTTEKTGNRLARKTIKQSMLDGILNAAREKLIPTAAFTSKDVWFDSDTGQEWRGAEVDSTRGELLLQLEKWSQEL